MLRAFATGTLTAFVIAAVNGGYVYKTTCPMPSGATSTSWTYGIDDVLPYIRQVSEPCETHTASRLALSAIGIAPLHGSKRDVPNASTARADARAARDFAKSEAAIITEFQREVLVAAGLTAQLNSGKLSRQEMAAKFKPVLLETVVNMRRILSAASAAPPADDSDLRQAQLDLRRWLRLQLKSDGLILSTLSGSSTSAELTAQTKRIRQQLGAVSKDLQKRTELLSPAYPSIRLWVDVLKSGEPPS